MAGTPSAKTRFALLPGHDGEFYAAAAGAVANVDAARLKNVAHLYRSTGLPPEQADAQAFLFYCFIFGQSLLFLERGPRKRAQLIAKSAEKLVDDQA